MGKQILVTGGAGYIASHVVRQLGENGYDVVVYDNCSTGVAAAVLYGKLVVADLGDTESLYRTFATHEIDAVLHFAASTSVPESINQPLDYYANNTRNTLNLLRCCQAFGINKFIFSSTAAVYGQSEENPVSESAATMPINPYGKSKLMSEWMIQDFARVSSLRYVILRYFNVAGADPGGRIGQFSPKASHLIKVACEAALGKRESVSVFGTDFPTPDGTGIRDYIHVEDLAAAHLDALSYIQHSEESKIFNCGYGKGYSVWEVLEGVKRNSGVDFTIKKAERRKGDPACVVAKADCIREVLGWTPKYDNLDVILDSTLNWEKKLATIQLPFIKIQ